MKKLIGLLVVLTLIFWGVSVFFQSEEKSVAFDVPSEQEQKALEESQPEPAFVPESELENQFPENAEKDS